MTWWNSESEQYNSYQTVCTPLSTRLDASLILYQVTEKPHEAEWSHELIAGAAAYEVCGGRVFRMLVVLTS